MKKILIGLMFISNLLFGYYDGMKECSIPPIIVEAVKKVAQTENGDFYIEKSTKSNLNKFYSIVKLNKDRGQLIGRFGFQCKSKDDCISVTKQLLGYGIKDITLGGFTISYKYHPFNIEDYFDEDKSRLRACEIIQSLFVTYRFKKEPQLKTLARYFSSHEKTNMKYQVELSKEIKKIIESNSQQNMQ